jgi:hypothetical protein
MLSCHLPGGITAPASLPYAAKRPAGRIRPSSELRNAPRNSPNCFRLKLEDSGPTGLPSFRRDLMLIMVFGVKDSPFSPGPAVRPRWLDLAARWPERFGVEKLVGRGRDRRCSVLIGSSSRSVTTRISGTVIPPPPDYDMVIHFFGGEPPLSKTIPAFVLPGRDGC